MGLKGKLISQTEIKGCKDLFHEMFKNKPHHLPNVVPQIIQAIDLHEEIGVPLTQSSTAILLSRGKRKL
ncbi:hypothetical protein RDI58_021896 [Solanum bulbocastanum]|uniref:Bet v I/Major latex protein domain-containing protein n=1 Tax=Solanum bulbocastanum TaxID=147425 RepID=A0AAN8Y5B6_SOLBU